MERIILVLELNRMKLTFYHQNFDLGMSLVLLTKTPPSYIQFYFFINLTNLLSEKPNQTGVKSKLFQKRKA